MRNKNAFVIYVITAVMLKAGVNPMLTMPKKISNAAYGTETIPKDLA